MTKSNPEGGDMRKPLTEMQRAFIDWCIAYSKFEIVDSMSISMVSAVANSYDFVAEEAKLDRYGYCTPSMIRWGKSLFPDPPGSPEGSGFDDAYEDVCTALDDWLRTFVMPMTQISFPPEPSHEGGPVYYNDPNIPDEQKPSSETP
ncbi:hypothetical protein [Burkholderia gladioli]|uniref:hypothetical protein n=2 Tax=Burkholderia gladioli TaxID=28095 RepID=UPI001FC89D7E|nr:hypothetical protein [Burkholderia gladioli]